MFHLSVVVCLVISSIIWEKKEITLCREDLVGWWRRSQRGERTARTKETEGQEGQSYLVNETCTVYRKWLLGSVESVGLINQRKCKQQTKTTASKWPWIQQQQWKPDCKCTYNSQGIFIYGTHSVHRGVGPLLGPLCAPSGSYRLVCSWSTSGRPLTVSSWWVVTSYMFDRKDLFALVHNLWKSFI